MNELPPVLRDQRKIDAEQLNLLAIFHFVGAGLALLALAFLFVHYSMMHLVFENPAMMNGGKGGPPPAEFFALFKWFYLLGAAYFTACCILNIVSGMSIHARKRRIFSFVVAASNCLHVPLGTVLGIFTIVVLARDSVREVYEVNSQS